MRSKGYIRLSTIVDTSARLSLTYFVGWTIQNLLYKQHMDVKLKYNIIWAEDIADPLSMRQVLMQKKKQLYPWIHKLETVKTKLWQLASSITIWYIWNATCLKVFQIWQKDLLRWLLGFWTEIVHNLRGSLDNIKGNMQLTELQWLKFHAILDRKIFDRQKFWQSGVVLLYTKVFI